MINTFLLLFLTTGKTPTKETEKVTDDKPDPKIAKLEQELSKTRLSLFQCKMLFANFKHCLAVSFDKNQDPKGDSESPKLRNLSKTAPAL
ncbi:MAG: hypothetical protein SP4CHLAM5_10120 [Chlamydiia bacterium]|nr:hypothetical protein [Chlamydiia bacterium]MCH9618869.1 hypothetical protein [Chlamydiia bacterium]MCH9623970.1 hypothetical protein [Chlamydiia bacterium]